MTGLLSPAHIAVLLVVLLLVFGAKRLPELGRSLGSGMREFKHSIATNPDDQPASLAPATTPQTTPSTTPETLPQPNVTTPLASVARPAAAEDAATPPAA